jgi:VanZ family protein
MALIVAVSSVPLGGKIPLVLDFQDKLAHFGEYMILAFLLARAFCAGNATPTSRRLVAALVAAAAFGLFDEIHQHFVPGRTASALDFAADAVGAMAGTLAWSILLHRKATRMLRNGILQDDPGAKDS